MDNDLVPLGVVLPFVPALVALRGRHRKACSALSALAVGVLRLSSGKADQGHSIHVHKLVPHFL